MNLRTLLSSLSLRLFLLLSATIAAAFGVYAVINIRTTSKSWEQAVHDGAERFSSVIQRSTHHGMLQNRKEDVHEIIRSIAEVEGVEGVRIYDKQGAIIFSADSAEIGQRVDLQAEACVRCHAHATPLESLPEGNRTRVFSRTGGERILGLIDPIVNAPECSTAACHAHPVEQSVLGVLDVTMSMAEPDRQLAAVERQAMIAAVLMALIAGLLSAAFILRLVRRPVKALISGVQNVANGNLDTAIPVKGRDEIGRLASAFNDMTLDLNRARAELTEWSDRLETRLREKTEELSRTQRGIAHMDKMASLGRLAATVAHELNNPLAGILNYSKLVERSLEDVALSTAEREEIGRSLTLIQDEASRSGAIVRNLLMFARPSGTRFAQHSLNTIFERAVMIVAHHLEISNVRLEAIPLEGNDQLVCDADQIQQALVALLVNGVEAMPDGGELRLMAEDLGADLRLTVSDTGVGIPAEVLPRVFEPFFSSHEASTGSGLGLAVVYGIVQHHGAKIEIESKVKRGTTVRIVLPKKPPTPSSSRHSATDPPAVAGAGAARS